MLNRLSAGLVLATLSAFAGLGRAATPDYSKEAFVIESMATKVTFSAEGARQWQQTFSVRIQSEAAVRQFGVLSLSYSADSEQAAIEYVRVRKPDGSVIETSAASVMDVATEIATIAPTYSDLRQKQIPVKGLSVGDVIQYAFRNTQQKPEFPGNFWYEQILIEDAVVLKESVELTIPKSKYVQVSSPQLKSEVSEQGDQRVYTWTHSHLQPSTPSDHKKQTAAAEKPLKIQVTTFKDWEEVGRWWGTLASEPAKVTPAIQQKANELTAGLTSDLDKAKAIYKYVAMQFRYISISFGAGKYRPHTAEEVLANRYGDCKDKHTLLAALMEAAGIHVWPALIGAGIKFDPSVPSPAQFNHVVTVWPHDGKYVWLDTTAEVAPFGALIVGIRDTESLVIPASAKPALMKTPLDLPFAASTTITTKASLASDGTLKGHFQIRMVGDTAIEMRGAFHQLAPAQWQAFVQQMSYAMGFAGDVSAVDVENISELDKPLEYSYDYERKKYSGWEEHRITPPIPPLSFGPGEDGDKPDEPFWAGARGELTYRASVQLPAGFSPDVPKDAKANSDFADYSSHYSFHDGLLTAERTMAIKQPKVALEKWPDYQRFAKDVSGDQSQWITLTEPAPVQKEAASGNPKAQQLITTAVAALRLNDLSSARYMLGEAERLNPKQQGLWSVSAFVASAGGNDKLALADLHKEIDQHPDDAEPYLSAGALLVHMNRIPEAIEIVRSGLARMPENEPLALQAAGLLIHSRRFDEVPAILDKPIAAASDKTRLRAVRAKALLRGNHKEEGLAEVRSIAETTSDPMFLNDAAFALADTDAGLSAAQELSVKSVKQTEAALEKVSLANPEDTALSSVSLLAAEWDTLGWIYFKQGNLEQAHAYVSGSWKLQQQAEVADHLAQILDKQGNRAAAIQYWQLALASNRKQEGVEERLRKAGVPATKLVPKESTEELNELRSIALSTLPNRSGSAEFYLLISQKGIEDVRFISGSDTLKDAASAIKAAAYQSGFPDSGSEKIVRRSVVYCSTYTKPSCKLTLFPLGSQDAKKPN